MADSTENPAENLYDAVIVGGGPAGLTAALYLARARYRVIVVERERFGGQITITNEVVNYPGVLCASGSELTETMRKQAEAFGAEFLLAEATSLDLSGDVKRVTTDKGDLEALAVLLATGASPRRVGFAGEEEFKGHGVAYCATCDGEFFTDCDVFVVGGGFAAAEEAVFLTKYARHVTILVRRDDFSCAPAASEPAKAHEKIDVIYNAEVVEVAGDSALRSITWLDKKTGEQTRFEAAPGETFGVFVFAGYEPATSLARGIAEINDRGYIITDSHNATTAPGLFAAGDVCVKELRQVATAVGEAAATSTEMERYLKAAQERTGLVPKQPTSRPKTQQAAGDAAAKAQGQAQAQAQSSALFDEAMLSQLGTVFERMQAPLVLRLHVDESDTARELEAYMTELASLTDKLSVQNAGSEGDDAAQLPYVEVCREDGSATGLEFHGVPGGHEFTSFVLGLYNAAGPGQPIADADRSGIAAISRPVDLRILVSLSCTMCPELVTAAQRIAAENPNVSAHVYDVAKFPALKSEFNVMSVPCLVIDEDGRQEVSFGKKGLAQLLQLIG